MLFLTAQANAADEFRAAIRSFDVFDARTDSPWILFWPSNNERCFLSTNQNYKHLRIEISGDSDYLMVLKPEDFNFRGEEILLRLETQTLRYRFKRDISSFQEVRLRISDQGLAGLKRDNQLILKAADQSQSISLNGSAKGINDLTRCENLRRISDVNADDYPKNLDDYGDQIFSIFDLLERATGKLLHNDQSLLQALTVAQRTMEILAQGGDDYLVYKIKSNLLILSLQSNSELQLDPAVLRILRTNLDAIGPEALRALSWDEGSFARQIVGSESARIGYDYLSVLLDEYYGDQADAKVANGEYLLGQAIWIFPEVSQTTIRESVVSELIKQTADKGANNTLIKNRYIAISILNYIYYMYKFDQNTVFPISVIEKIKYNNLDKFLKKRELALLDQFHGNLLLDSGQYGLSLEKLDNSIEFFKSESPKEYSNLAWSLVSKFEALMLTSQAEKASEVFNQIHSEIRHKLRGLTYAEIEFQLGEIRMNSRSAGGSTMHAEFSYGQAMIKADEIRKAFPDASAKYVVGYVKSQSDYKAADSYRKAVEGANAGYFDRDAILDAFFDATGGEDPTGHSLYHFQSQFAEFNEHHAVLDSTNNELAILRDISLQTEIDRAGFQRGVSKYITNYLDGVSERSTARIDPIELTTNLRSSLSLFRDTKLAMKFNLVGSTTYSLDQIQRYVGDEEALIIVSEPSTTYGRIYIWVVTRDDFSWHSIELDIISLTSMINEIRGNLQPHIPRREITESLVTLFEAVYEPFQETWDQKSRLTFVLDGSLSKIPPGLLFRSHKDGAKESGSWLIEDFDLAQYRSIGQFVRNRGELDPPAGDRENLFFADPVIDGELADGSWRGLGRTAVHNSLDSASVAYGRLPGARDEVDTVSETTLGESSVFKGEHASEARLREMRGTTFKYLYFATHAIVAKESLAFAKFGGEPALLLGKTGDIDEQDGLVFASDIQSLKIGADLVVLSGCNTAAGSEFNRYAFSGLVDSFLRGGARAVLASHWPVDDKSTAQFMKSFFEKYETKAGGQAVRELNNTMREFIQGKWGSKLEHPYYWSAFSLLGEPSYGQPVN